MKENTRLYTPKTLRHIEEKIMDKLQYCSTNSDHCIPAEIEVTEESTLAAAKRLKGDGYNTVCLNFASATNPGGGFLDGSSAQEESLARASGLYASICSQKRYYEANRNCGSGLYTDHMIYSPSVSVFRDDDDELLDRPYHTSFITAPAVNAGIVRNREPKNIARIGATMYQRIKKILCLGAHHEHDAFVLGAFGCGVFKNDPEEVADHFRRYLSDETSNDRVVNLAKLFCRVVFAVLSKDDKTNYEIFKRRLMN